MRPRKQARKVSQNIDEAFSDGFQRISDLSKVGVVNTHFRPSLPLVKDGAGLRKLAWTSREAYVAGWRQCSKCVAAALEINSEREQLGNGIMQVPATSSNCCRLIAERRRCELFGACERIAGGLRTSSTREAAARVHEWCHGCAQ